MARSCMIRDHVYGAITAQYTIVFFRGCYILSYKGDDLCLYTMHLKDKDDKTIKKGGTFQYTNLHGETKAFVYHGTAKPHPTTKDLYTITCHYCDEPDKTISRNMYIGSITKITRLSRLYKMFKARYINRK